MSIKDIFGYTTKWPVASKYIIEEGYIKPDPDATFKYINPFDYFEADNPSEAIHYKLANLYKRNEGDSHPIISQKGLLEFVSEFGLLGLGRRFLIIKESDNLEEMELLLENEGLEKSHKKQIILARNPLNYRKLKDLSQNQENNKSDPNILMDFSLKRIESGNNYFPFFFPDKKLNEIQLSEEEFWKNYCEPIGNLEYPDLLPTQLDNELTDKFFKIFPRIHEIKTLNPDYTYVLYFRDTLTYHITHYALAFDSSIRPPKLPKPGETEDSKYSGRIEIEQNMDWHLNSMMRPTIKLSANRITKKDRYEWQLCYEFASLIDICYGMLMLELTEGKKIIRCQWCGKITRLRDTSSHNACFCPPYPQKDFSKSCSSRYTKLKSQQRKLWNELLMEKYNKDIEKLQLAWKMSKIQPKPNKGKWFTRADYAVFHPMDLAKQQILTDPALIDYLKWRNSKSLKNPKNNRILNDDLIFNTDSRLNDVMRKLIMKYKEKENKIYSP